MGVSIERKHTLVNEILDEGERSARCCIVTVHDFSHAEGAMQSVVHVWRVVLTYMRCMRYKYERHIYARIRVCVHVDMYVVCMYGAACISLCVRAFTHYTEMSIHTYTKKLGHLHANKVQMTCKAAYLHWKPG